MKILVNFHRGALESILSYHQTTQQLHSPQQLHSSDCETPELILKNTQHSII